jgi:hypothetical protein
MAILDTQNKFSDAQAVTSTAISTDVIDLNPNGGPNTTRDLGMGEQVFLSVVTHTTCTDTGSDATLTVTLESSAVVGLTSSTVHASTTTLAFATYATAGTTVWRIALPSATYQRYLGLRYTIASGPLTAGAFDAYLTNNQGVTIPVAYARNFTV